MFLIKLFILLSVFSNQVFSMACDVKVNEAAKKLELKTVAHASIKGKVRSFSYGDFKYVASKFGADSCPTELTYTLAIMSTYVDGNKLCTVCFTVKQVESMDVNDPIIYEVVDCKPECREMRDRL